MFLIEIYSFNIFKIKISLVKFLEAYIIFWKLKINFKFLEKYQTMLQLNNVKNFKKITEC